MYKKAIHIVVTFTLEMNLLRDKRVEVLRNPTRPSPDSNYVQEPNPAKQV